MCECSSKEKKTYCYDCNLLICDNCAKGFHSTHSISNEAHIISKEQLSNFEETFAICLSLMEQNYKDIREHISNKDNKEQLEAIINESEKENNSIMTIIQIILQNYNKNYQNILYLLENVTFNSTKFIKNEFENDSVLKSYINNYVVAFEKLYQKGTNIKIIQTQKITQKFYGKSYENKVPICRLKDGTVISGCQGYFFTVDPGTLHIQYLKHNRKSHKSSSGIIQLKNGKMILDIDKDLYLVSIVNNELKFEQKMEGHSGAINQIINLSFNRFASCSEDNTIVLWKSEVYFGISSLSEHTGPVKSICQLKGKEILVSGSTDGNIFFWDIDGGYDVQETITGIKVMNSNSIRELSNDRIMIGAAEPNRIVIINTESYDTIFTITQLDLFESNLNSGMFCFDDVVCGKIAVGCPSGGVCLIDENSYEIVAKKEKVHSSGVKTIFRVADNIYITSANDTLLKLWQIE